MSVLRLTRFIGLLALSLCCAISAQAADKDDALITKLTTAQIKRIMQEEGYSVSDSPKGNVVWKIEGYSAVVQVMNKGDGLLFSAAFSDKTTMDKVNAWNRSKSYSRSYLDDEGDPVIESDMEVAGGVTRARLVDFFKTCRVTLRSWTKDVLH